MNLIRSFALFAASVAASDAQTTTPPPNEGTGSGCPVATTTTTTPPPLRKLSTVEDEHERDLKARGPVVGRVKVSGSDAALCEYYSQEYSQDYSPGCDGAFSVSAKVREDDCTKVPGAAFGLPGDITVCDTVDGMYVDNLLCRNTLKGDVDAVVFCPSGGVAVCASGLTIVRDKTDTPYYRAIFAWDGGATENDYYTLRYGRPEESEELLPPDVVAALGDTWCNPVICLLDAPPFGEYFRPLVQVPHVNGQVQVVVPPPDVFSKMALDSQADPVKEPESSAMAHQVSAWALAAVVALWV